MESCSNHKCVAPASVKTLFKRCEPAGQVFGKQVEVQCCRIHKRRNVQEYLPENRQKAYSLVG